MKITTSILTGMFLCGALASGGAWSADSETADLPENILAKMARYKAKRFNDESDKSFLERRRGDQIGSCGGLNVGNVTAGRGGRMPRQVTVVISGDVINANNKCN
ncbi:MAG: hypothetical protein KDH20_19020 [Rhodocyclaceae bacterium]|nr:hypothetical protein [Rhodocyclaceae bacterium]